jgi:hypothetical protein
MCCVTGDEKSLYFGLEVEVDVEVEFLEGS